MIQKRQITIITFFLLFALVIISCTSAPEYSKSSSCEELSLRCIDICDGATTQCLAMEKMEDCNIRLRWVIKQCLCLEEHSFDYCSMTKYDRLY